MRTPSKNRERQQLLFGSPAGAAGTSADGHERGSHCSPGRQLAEGWAGPSDDQPEPVERSRKAKGAVT